MSTVAINTLRSTGPNRLAEYTDHGLFVRDLGERGLDLVMTNIDTYKEGGDVIRVHASEADVQFSPATIQLDTLTSMHNRIVFPQTSPKAAHIPMLNSNVLKGFVGSKHHMYEMVSMLGGHQVQTELIRMNDDAFNDLKRVLDVFADERDITVKSDSGTGSKSTLHMTIDQLATYIDTQMQQDKKPNLIVQPTIYFGPLPAGITGRSKEDKALVRSARQNGLLNELRVMTIMSGDKQTYVPMLRVVAQKGEAMGDGSDVYVDIDIDQTLFDTVSYIAGEVVKETADRAGGVDHVLAAVDFYFDTNGRPMIMEANMRSPAIPITRENPHVGRLVHSAIADTLHDMSEAT